MSSVLPRAQNRMYLMANFTRGSLSRGSSRTIHPSFMTGITISICMGSRAFCFMVSIILDASFSLLGASTAECPRYETKKDSVSMVTTLSRLERSVVVVVVVVVVDVACSDRSMLVSSIFTSVRLKGLSARMLGGLQSALGTGSPPTKGSSSLDCIGKLLSAGVLLA